MARQAKSNSSSVGLREGDPALDRYLDEFGGGVMVLEPKHFGAAFLPASDGKEDLIFVSRKMVH
jgi:hypothetical protein